MLKSTVARQRDITPQERQHAFDDLWKIVRDRGTIRSRLMSDAVGRLAPSRHRQQQLSSNGEYGGSFVKGVLLDLQRHGALEGVNLRGLLKE